VVGLGNKNSPGDLLFLSTISTNISEGRKKFGLEMTTQGGVACRQLASARVELGAAANELELVV
jgi:hypothetical protein